MARMRRAATLANRTVAGLLIVSFAGVAWTALSSMRCGYPARETAATHGVLIEQAIERYQVERRGGCPESLDELARTGIVLRVPNDPWGEPYAFRCSADEAPHVWSAGADNEFGTEDDVGAQW